MRGGGGGYLAVTTAGAVCAAAATLRPAGFGDTTTRQTPTATSLTSGYDADGGADFFVVYTALGNSGTLDIPSTSRRDWPSGTLDVPIPFRCVGHGHPGRTHHFAVFGRWNLLWTASAAGQVTCPPADSGRPGGWRRRARHGGRVYPAAIRRVVSPWTGAGDEVRILGRCIAVHQRGGCSQL